MFDVDEGGEPAFFLGLGDHAQTEGRLTGGFRSVDLDDAALGQAADAEGEIHGEGAGGEGLDLHLGVGAETHDGAVAELFGDGREGELDVFLAGVGEKCASTAKILASVSGFRSRSALLKTSWIYLDHLVGKKAELKPIFVVKSKN